jgi:hypothetical protein
VGLDYFERAGLVGGGEAPVGLVDRVADLASPWLDPALIDPAVAEVLEQTARFEFEAIPGWMPPFRLAARVFRWLMGFVGQLRMPLVPSRILTRTVALDAADGRPGARGVLRRYVDGGVMQVLAYAACEVGGAGYLSVAFPFPWSCLNGLLSLDAVSEGPAPLAVALTSEGRGAASGIWLALGGWWLPTPFAETMSLWPAAHLAAPPADLSRLPGASVISVHEQRLFGRLFARHTYLFRRLPAPPGNT